MLRIGAQTLAASFFALAWAAGVVLVFAPQGCFLAAQGEGWSAGERAIAGLYWGTRYFLSEQALPMSLAVWMLAALPLLALSGLSIWRKRPSTRGRGTC